MEILENVPPGKIGKGGRESKRSFHSQPSPSNPFGNPDPNAVPVRTVSGGLTWVQYLTTKYNQSFIETFNFAAAGATISNSVLGIDGENDLEHQISNHFQPIYATSNGSSNWTATNSLFTLYFGINDIAHTWRQHNGTTSDLVFASYRSLIDQLYTLGARNFLIHNVPPFNRGPSQAGLGRAAQQDQGNTINDYNYRINVLSASFTNAHPDASLLTFQTNQLFTNILSEGVDCYEQSAGLKNLTQSCEAYNKGHLPTVDYFNASCGVPLKEYFWLDGLHPTYTVQDALAGAVAKALG
ncbi:MAG: hypothetical protein LQ351_006226 [Letrouitia transgressa]|nr:MAG: hypothetical protein LQ351_006226 [Letrouitia transgressa]